MNTQEHCRRPAGKPGFTLAEVLIVCGLVGLLAALAVPNALRARTSAARHLCLSNLRQIESAKEQWAMEFKKAPTDIPADSDLFGRDQYLRYKPKCPAGGVYTLGACAERATCSIPDHTR